MGQTQVIVPDGLFWYTLSGMLALALIGIIWRYVDKNDKRHEEHEDIFKMMAKTQSDMSTMLAVHEEKHEQHDRDIEELKHYRK